MAVSTLCRPRSRKLESVSCQREGPVRIDRLHAVALGHHLAQQAFLRAEVVEEPRRRHADPIGQRGHPGAAVALGREELDGGVDDLLPAQVAAGLAAVLVRAGVLPVTGAARPAERPALPLDPRAAPATGSLDPAPRSRRQKTVRRSDRLIGIRARVAPGQRREDARSGPTARRGSVREYRRPTHVGLDRSVPLAQRPKISYSPQKSHSRHIRVRVRGQRIDGCQSVG